MKSCSIFVFIFIGFLVFLVNGEDLDSFDAASTVPSDASTQAPDAATTPNSGNTGAPSSGTDEPVSQGTGETDAPQSTVQSGSTVAAQTTAPAPSCPQKPIVYVNATTPFTVKVPANLNCTYFARSASFLKSLKVTGVNAPTDTTILIIGNSGLDFDSSKNLTTPDFSTNSSQITITILTKTSEADITFSLELEDVPCPANYCKNSGTCTVVQGQPTCKCVNCFIGPTCDVPKDPCVTYQLFCTAQGKQCITTGCTATCTP